MFPKCGKIKVANSKYCNGSQFKNITTHKSQKWLIFQNINTSKFKSLKAHNMIPLSSLKRLLVTCQNICSQIINHLIIATHTQIG